MSLLIGKPGINGRTAENAVVFFPVVGADVWIYATEEDYLLNRNSIEHGYSDENGIYVFYRKEEGLEHWFRVKKGDLSNDRYASEERPCFAGYLKRSNYLEYLDGHGDVRMTTQPSKLQLTVMHNGAPVEGANVQLYFSREAYEKDLKAHLDFEELEAVYGSPDPAKGTLFDCVEKSFHRLSNAEGAVYFPDLEAKQYWFRITKEELSNEGGTIKLEEPLSEDPNITKSITVGIN